MAEEWYAPEERFTAARATPELVGRDKYLDEIAEAIGEVPHTRIVYLVGEGGIGKTRVIDHILKHPPDGSWIVASRPIDLYHTRVHSLSGLIGAILEVVEPLDEFVREHLEPEVLEDLEKAEREGLSWAEVIARRKETTEKFLEIFNRFTRPEEHRVILALDTAERLLAQQDPVQERLGLQKEHFSILQWLLNDFLPRVENTVVLLAGRPQPGNLKEELIRSVGEEKIRVISLPGLDLDETLEYIEAVIQAARERGETGPIQRLLGLPEERRRIFFHCLRDEDDTVRPILLALAIDRIAVSGVLPKWLDLSEEEAKSLEPARRTEIKGEIGEELIAAIRSARRPADEVIITLGWLRKGADIELLAHIAEMDEGVVKWAVEQIRGLSFIKERAGRLFLHDEMYFLLHRQLLQSWAPRREEIFPKIQSYYQQRIEEAREEIAHLYESVEARARESEESAGLPPSKKVVEVYAHLQDALVEDLHYRLRWNAADGFQKYFLYAEEAIAAADESLDMQLRAELMQYLVEQDPSGKSKEIDGLHRDDVYADAAVRWVKRLINRGEYERAIEVAEKAREFAQQGGVWAQVEMQAWEALALIYQGKIAEAQTRCAEALQIIGNTEPPSDREKAILARLYNNLGYISRVNGRYEEARENYRKAIPLWREIGLLVEAANTLNNLAFVLAGLGEIERADRQARTALEYRERIGPRSPVGLSLTTLAQIAIQGNLLITAERYAKRALDLFEVLKDRRGIGLACYALAEAKRRWGEQKSDPKALDEAIHWARKGEETFRELGADDRVVELLIELGCAYRDLAKVKRGPHPTQESITPLVQEFAEKGKKALEEAARIADERGILYRQVDALVNLAWLRYYVLQEREAEETLKKAFQLIPDQYFIKEGSGLSQLDRREMMIPLLMQLGKGELLRGQIQFNEYEREGEEKALERAIEHYTLSLEYDHLASEREFRDVKRAKERIRERLARLNLQALSRAKQMLGEVEERYNLETSEMRRFLEEEFLV